MLNISLVVPVFNESKTIAALIDTIKQQTVQPGEIILVDGGSTDNTVALSKELAGNDQRFIIIEAGRAMPGKGRNIGAAKAKNEWIAFTDAGIKLDKYWLQNLVATAEANPQADIIYGNYAPQVNSIFDKWSAITYVTGAKPGALRGRSIVSCLLKKKIWEEAGGFPNWRAAEDMVFMERVTKLGYPEAYAPDAKVFWELRPGLLSAFKKFDVYSKYNVWAGWQARWHYGVARQYIVVLLVILLGIFHSSYWFWLLPVWIIARVARRIYPHIYELGIKEMFNPITYFGVMLVTFIMDAGTFSGWIKAIFNKPPEEFNSL